VCSYGETRHDRFDGPIRSRHLHHPWLVLCSHAPLRRAGYLSWQRASSMPPHTCCAFSVMFINLRTTVPSLANPSTRIQQESVFRHWSRTCASFSFEQACIKCVQPPSSLHQHTSVTPAEGLSDATRPRAIGRRISSWARDKEEKLFIPAGLRSSSADIHADKEDGFDGVVVGSHTPEHGSSACEDDSSAAAASEGVIPDFASHPASQEL
jgi:hypothetical protein